MEIKKNGNDDSPPQALSPDQGHPSHADGHPTMSAVILTLVEPLLKKYGTNVKRAESIIGLAVAAWNKTMIPAEAQDDFEQAIIDVAVPPDGDAELVGAAIEIMEMIEDRRKRLFPNLRVVIAKYDLQVAGGRLTLNVGSAPIPAGK